MLFFSSASKKSNSNLESILNDILIDQDYEKLFLARVFESLLICENELNDKVDTRLANLFYQTYPTLVPFSGISIPMRLHSNEKTADEITIIKQLKSTTINWTTDLGINANDVYINFSHKGNLSLIEYAVKNSSQVLIEPTSISYNQSTMPFIPKQLCFYIFNVGNSDKGINMK